MILRTCAADFEPLNRFHENIEAMGIPQLTMDTKKAPLKLIVERLPILTEQLKDHSRKSAQHSEAIGEIHTDIENLTERMDDTESFDLFSINLDLMWIIERSAKILIEGSKVKVARIEDSDSHETQAKMNELSCPYPEAFTTWSYHFTAPLQITPLKLHKVEHQNLISLGQKYSVSDYRRCCYIKPSDKQKIMQLDPEECRMEWSEFNEAYQGWTSPPVIPPQQVELSHEKLEAFDTLQMQFQKTLAFIQSGFSESDDHSLLIWFHDETLQDRMSMEFDHQEDIQDVPTPKKPGATAPEKPGASAGQ